MVFSNQHAVSTKPRASRRRSHNYHLDALDNMSILSIGGESDKDNHSIEEARRATRHLLATNGRSSLWLQNPNVLFRTFLSASTSSGCATMLTSQLLQENDDDGYNTTTCSSHPSSEASTTNDDELLYKRARKALQHVDAMAKRTAMIGKWKVCKRITGSSDHQVMECKTNDDYSVIAKVNIRCTLHEILHIYSSDDSETFHASMVAIFGELYVRGTTVHQIDADQCARFRRHSMPRRSTIVNRNSQSVSAAQIFVKVASFVSKNKYDDTNHSLSYLDYVEEKSEKKSATRVLQTLDEDQDYASSSGSTSIKGLMAGYVIQEDSDDQFTRIFFYAKHTKQTTDRQNDAVAIDRVREMARMVCHLESIIVRRRLGMFAQVQDAIVLLQSHGVCCASCHRTFHVVLRRKHVCHLCGQWTCSSCSTIRHVEKRVGCVTKYRICHHCVTGAMDHAFHTSSSVGNHDASSEEEDEADLPVMMALHPMEDDHDDHEICDIDLAMWPVE